MKGSGFIEIDVHGMNRFQAKTYIDSVLKKAGRDVYRIDIVHGYRSGSSLKEMVRKEYRSHPKVKRSILKYHLFLIRLFKYNFFRYYTIKISIIKKSGSNIF